MGEPQAYNFGAVSSACMPCAAAAFLLPQPLSRSRNKCISSTGPAISHHPNFPHSGQSVQPMLPCALPHPAAGGSPFASACATLLPERVEALLLVCPLAPMFGRETELLHGIAPVSRQLFTAFNRAPWAARLQLTVIRQVCEGAKGCQGVRGCCMRLQAWKACFSWLEQPR